MNMFGFYASDYYRGKIEETLLKSLDRKFHMPKYRKSVVRVFTDLLHSIQETVIQYGIYFEFLKHTWIEDINFELVFGRIQFQQK